MLFKNTIFLKIGYLTLVTQEIMTNQAKDDIVFCNINLYKPP